MKPQPRLLLGSIVALLVLGIAAQFLFQLGRAPSAEILPADILPNQLAGVVVKDLDIGGTELLNAAIAEGLGFSDYRYKEYRRGNDYFTIYLGYWQARQRHFMDLGTHAPDNCWVSNGMTMLPKLPKHTFALGAEGSAMWPAETRTFDNRGLKLHVVYWHLLNGKPIDYTRYGTGKTLGYLLDNISGYWRGTGEQYFIRIMSPMPIAELEQDAAFQRVLASLAKHAPLAARN